MIRVTGVSYRYEPGGDVLRDVSFEVARGERVVLLGSNGSGKTTLLRVMDGLIFPSSGEVEYEGSRVTKHSLRVAPLRDTFRREVVLLFQNPEAMIFNPTVFDEIAFGPRQMTADVAEIDGRVRRWAELFGITRHLDRPAFQLSKGEIQKVCLASLLALEPKLLLLDEPTASLDPRSTGWLIDFLQDLDLTIVVTTHNLSMARELGERTLVLSEHHEIIFDGEIDALLGDRAKLMEANLVHSHRHAHGEVEHRHYHTHDWD
jgi:cobalt/nickel transport system ATP-binding protein